MKRSAAAICLLTVISWSAAARAENWPQWRGPNSDGVSKETNVPTAWSETKNIAWKLKMPGMAGSTPAVWDDRIFLTSAERNDLVVLCVSTDGKQLWKRKVGSGVVNARNDEGNSASPSPITDGTHVYAFFGNGDFVCFDFKGTQVWKFNAQERYGKFKYGFGSHTHTTPVLHGGRLYFQLIHSGGAWVAAIDKATGSDVWKVARKSDGRDECEHSYASAFLWSNGKNAYLVVHGNDYTTAHNLEDGSEIWRVGGLNPKNKYNPTLRFVASPLVTPDLIVIPSAKRGPVVALKPDAKGLVMPGSPFELWRLSANTPDVPSPLLVDGLVYLCREDGTLMCLDAKTGAEKYKPQRTHQARYRASPVYADGKIYLTGRDGVITVVKAGPKFQSLATNKLDDQVSASPVIAQGKIFIRGFNSLYAIGSSAK